MTARAVYVCVNCPWVYAAEKGNDKYDAIAAAQGQAHERATGHQTVLQRVKMPWEVA